jgi:hypothetical protein
LNDFKITSIAFIFVRSKSKTLYTQNKIYLLLGEIFIKNTILFSLVLGLSTSAVAATKLSAEQTQKVKAAYIANGTGDGDTYAINPSQLVGAAATAYAKLTEVQNCKSFGYCPEAYAIPVDGIKTLAVAVSDDGGTYIDVFAADGSKITSCSAGESDDMTCE